MTATIKQFLAPYRQRRLDYCGAPLPALVRADGTRIENVRYRCTDRYCKSCARAKSQRAYACILSKLTSAELDTGDDARLVTLTIESRPGLTGQDLSEAIERLGRVQGEAHRRLRRHDYASTRIDHHRKQGKMRRVARWKRERERQLLKKLRAPLGSGEDLSEYRDTEDRYPNASGGKTTYIWAREITTGSKNRGWHVHAHYLVPTPGDASRLVAAWLAAAFACRIKADPRAQYISQPRRATYDGGEDGEHLRSAARYITQYITKSDVGEWSDEAIRALIYGTHGMRQYDAGGRWRPLGIGRRRNPEQSRVERVAYPVFTLSVTGELRVEEKAASFSDVMRGAGPVVEAWRRGRVLSNQYRTNLTNGTFVELTGKLAVIRRLKRPTNFIPLEKLQKYRNFVAIYSEPGENNGIDTGEIADII